MVDQSGRSPQAYSPGEFPQAFAEIAERSQCMVNDWMARHGMTDAPTSASDPFNVTTLFLDLASKMMALPASVVSAQMSLWQDYFSLWQNTTSRMLGRDVFNPPLPNGSGHLRDAAWQDADVFTYIQQSYLLAARWLHQGMRGLGFQEAPLREGVDFYTRQFMAALSPTDFALTNPEVVRATIESQGENLINGLRNLLRGLEQAGQPGGRLANSPFELGQTIAATPGKVLFRNPLMEVIQYNPITDHVVERPLLFVPSWTGRYYILDLCISNSLVRWAVEQGHTVFTISWAEANGVSAGRPIDSYVLDGLLTALDVVASVTGPAPVNVAGHGLGGTLLAATLAYLQDACEDRIGSASFLTTLIDFSQPGELGALIDDATLCLLEEASEIGGPNLVELAKAASLQRENDLIWSFVVNSYLLGHDAFPLDLLYWNRDTPRLLQALHGFYLHALYRQNRLVEPGGLRIASRPLDLQRVHVPAYFLATREDHIAPWKSAYKATHLLGNRSRFTLAASGHLTGVINPPGANRYCYWTNTKTPANPDEWQAGARAVEGSWWGDWDAWLKRLVSEERRVPARAPGDGPLTPIGDAPGLYVRTAA